MPGFLDLLSVPLLVDRTIGQLDDHLSELASRTGADTVNLVSDIFGSTNLLHNNFGGSGTTHYGRIQMSLPFFGWYRVAVQGYGVLPCCQMEVATAPTLLGPRSTSIYPADTEVLVHLFQAPAGLHGIILGAIPAVVDDANVNFPDYVLQGSGVGALRDGHYLNYLQQTADEGGVKDFSNSRPIDQTSLDYGVMTETGVGLHVDPFLAMLRVDETCCVAVCYLDQFLLVAGYNSDYTSAVHEEQYRNDDGELTYYRGECIYPWESLGAAQPTIAVHREVTDLNVQFETHEAKLEPLTTDQMPFHRYQEYGGYLGQGRLRQVSVPAQNTTELHTLSSTGAPVCVFREFVGLDGEFLLQSAKRVTLAKRSLIPYPKRVQLQAEQTAQSDSPNNYRFSGVAAEQSSGAAHQVADLQSQGDYANWQLSSAVLDVQAYAANWKSVHPFHYHQHDFSLPEEGETGQPLQKLQQDIPFSALETDLWLPAVAPKQLNVDHRQQATDYYEVLSHISLLDDGSLSISGGGGCELRFVAGSIVLSCPGNVYLQPGKSVVALAGDDLILRARNSVDVTSALKDVRIKAEHNLQLLSGNDGTGGTLIENRAQGRTQSYPVDGGEAVEATGIVFKSAQSHVSALASEIYLRTGNDSVNPGPIVLDASKGVAGGDVHLIGRNFTRFLKGTSSDVFLSSTDVVQQVNHATFGYTFIGSTLAIAGSFQANGFARIRSNVISAEGTFLSPTGAPVGRLRDSQSEKTAILNTQSDARTRESVFATAFGAEIRVKYYLTGQIGNKTTQEDVAFSLRNEAQYGTTAFQMPLTHWQQLTTTGKTWSEPDVEYRRGHKRLPWPGKIAWEGDNFLKITNYRYFDPSTGRDKDRAGGSYEQAELPEFTPVSGSQGYTVIDC